MLCAIYGFIESAHLWYNMYILIVKVFGLKIDSYCRCVANNIIVSKQCNLVWYVHDNKWSHIDSNVITNIFNILKGDCFGVLWLV